MQSLYSAIKRHQSSPYTLTSIESLNEDVTSLDLCLALQAYNPPSSLVMGAMLRNEPSLGKGF